MGFPVWSLPSARAPYAQVDPFILVHERASAHSEFAGMDSKHPHEASKPVVHHRRFGQHRSQHRPGGPRAGPVGRGFAADAQDGPWCLARRGGGSGRGRRGLSRHRVPRRALLGQSPPEGQAGRPNRRVVQPTRFRCAGRATPPSGSWSAVTLRSGWNACAHPRHRAAGGRRGHDPLRRVPGLRLRAWRRGCLGANRRRAQLPSWSCWPRCSFRVTDAAPGTRYLLMAGHPSARPPLQRAVRGLAGLAIGAPGRHDEDGRIRWAISRAGTDVMRPGVGSSRRWADGGGLLLMPSRQWIAVASSAGRLRSLPHPLFREPIADRPPSQVRPTAGGSRGVGDEDRCHRGASCP